MLLDATHPDLDRPDIKRQQHDVAHDVGGGDEKYRGKKGEQCNEKRQNEVRLCRGAFPIRRGQFRWTYRMQLQVPTTTLRQSKGAKNSRYRPNQKGRVKRYLAPAKDRCHSGNEIRTEWWVLHRVPHGFPHTHPVYLKTVRIERMSGDLLRHPEKKRIVDMERFIHKRRKSGDCD